jgi:hypothetical protein
VERQVVLPAPHDGLGEEPGSGEAARDRQLRRLGLQDLRFGGAGMILRDELRLVHADHDDRRPAVLDGLADILSDAPERVEPAPLNFGREDLQVDAREILRQWLAPGRLLAGVRADLFDDRRGVVRRAGVVAEQQPEQRHRQLRVRR